MHCIISFPAAAQRSRLVAAVLAVVAVVHAVQLPQHASSGLGATLPTPLLAGGQGEPIRLGELSHYTGVGSCTT
eukprot:13120768-Heterocapsa_arctica.AAC.1